MLQTTRKETREADQRERERERERGGFSQSRAGPVGGRSSLPSGLPSEGARA